MLQQHPSTSASSFFCRAFARIELYREVLATPFSPMNHDHLSRIMRSTTRLFQRLPQPSVQPRMKALKMLLNERTRADTQEPPHPSRPPSFALRAATSDSKPSPAGRALDMPINARTSEVRARLQISSGSAHSFILDDTPRMFLSLAVSSGTGQDLEIGPSRAVIALAFL